MYERALVALDRDEASARINKFFEKSQAVIDSVEVVLARPAEQLHLAAIERQCKAIVLGNHGRHGWQRILGSTAHAVLHGAPVDVLLIRLIA